MVIFNLSSEYVASFYWWNTLQEKWAIAAVQNRRYSPKKRR